MKTPRKLIDKLDIIFSNSKYRLIFLIIITPVFWWVLLNFVDVISEFVKTPLYIQRKFGGIYSVENLRNTVELRWINVETVREGFYPRLFYNKLTVLVDQFFDYLTLFSPKLYFQQGGNGISSPPGVEPIPILLYPFFIMGLHFLIQKKKLLPLTMLFLSSTIAFIADQRNFYFLFPTVIVYLSISNRGLQVIRKKKLLKYFSLILLIYSGFLFLRVIYLTL